MGDTWYRFATAPVSVAPPDRLRVTREWVKAGKTWGECTITVQSSARWHIWMWLPTTTNADYFQLNRPNELHDDGRLFRWFDDCPLEQGVVFKVKVPIEVGAGVKEYYPRIKLERGSSDFGNTDQQQKAKVHAATTAELAIALTSEAEILSEYDFPGSIDVMLDEVKR